MCDLIILGDNPKYRNRLINDFGMSDVQGFLLERGTRVFGLSYLYHDKGKDSILMSFI